MENKDFVQKVVLFNEIGGNPNEFNTRKAALYFGLIMEELSEKFEALDTTEATDIQTNELADCFSTIKDMSEKFKKGYFDNVIRNMDRVASLDADVDIAVVALGSAHCTGADVNGACHNVADSNLSKYPIVDGKHKVFKDENGKIKKPASYKAPSLEQFLF